MFLRRLSVSSAREALLEENKTMLVAPVLEGDMGDDREIRVNEAEDHKS